MSTRREDLVRSARELFEEKGIGSTSPKDITERSGVSRTLFYHYFPDMDALILAVVDNYMDELVSMVKDWNETRAHQDFESTLRESIELFREVVYNASTFRRTLSASGYTELYLIFLNRSTETLSHYLVETIIADYREYHNINIDYVPETLYVLITGLVGFIRNYPEVDDEVLMTIITQTLHLEG